jgi:gas vesicle protein
VNVRTPWFVGGFLLGCAVAAAATLLYAPASGADTLAAIRAHFAKARREAREAGMRAEAEILTRYKQGLSTSSPLAPSAPSLAPAPTV